MEEQWKNLKIEHFEDFKISNTGKLMSHKGKIRQPCYNGNILQFNIRRKINGKTYRIARNVKRLVFEYFSNYDIGNKKVKSKKGTNTCNFEDLKCLGFTKPNKRQLELIDKYFYKYAYSITRKKQYYLYCKYGFDLENCIQESALNVYEFIGETEIETEKEFYCAVASSLRFAILKGFKKWERPMELING